MLLDSLYLNLSSWDRHYPHDRIVRNTYNKSQSIWVFLENVNNLGHGPYVIIVEPIHSLPILNLCLQIVRVSIQTQKNIYTRILKHLHASIMIGPAVNA